VGLSFASVGHAETILDTGPGPSSSSGVDLGGHTNNWIAVGFNLADASIITTVEGWIHRYATGDVTFVLYDASGADGRPGSELYAQSGRITAGSSWQGVSGLNWDLDSGDYWLAFEVRADSTFRGGMGLGVPDPTGPGSVSHTSGDVWTAARATTEIGARIYGDADPIYSCVGPIFHENIVLENIVLEDKPKKDKKSESTIQVALDLVDTVNGAPVTEAELPSPPVINVTFNASEVTDVINNPGLIPKGQAYSGNQLDYDGSYWRFNLDTGQYAAAGTYWVTIEPGDGSYAIDENCSGTFSRMPQVSN
jgi:hypothetical protein